ncbi:hypothetical protein C8F01DRAFT_1165054 [Mycena amicta]|nr:hypothetical protein C8F01DRAFT_1165054 [Mycena amicta]
MLPTLLLLVKPWSPVLSVSRLLKFSIPCIWTRLSPPSFHTSCSVGPSAATHYPTVVFQLASGSVAPGALGASLLIFVRRRTWILTSRCLKNLTILTQ